MLKTILNIIFFVCLNFFLKKVINKIHNFKKSYLIFLFLFFILIILIGRIYDYLYIEMIMLEKEKFIVLLLFSFSSLIINLTHSRIISVLNIKNRLKNNSIYSILEINFFSFIIILITLVQIFYMLSDNW